jgi:hypothetical protein
MSFQGMIEDVAVADVMQLIRIGGHSGSLTVNNGVEEGIIGFERGRIVSAWNPRTRRIGELLLDAGVVDEAILAAALKTQNEDRPRRTVGHYLVHMGATTSEVIRDVMAREIERVVGEICSWQSGSFEFAIDDLTPLVEVTRFTGAPKVDLDTQTVLMDVLRRMEEASAPAPEEVVETGAFVEAQVEEHSADSREFEATFQGAVATLGNAPAPAGLAAESGSDEAPPASPPVDATGGQTGHAEEAEEDEFGASPTEATAPDESLSAEAAPPELPAPEAMAGELGQPQLLEYAPAEPMPPEADDAMRFQMVSPDRELCERVNQLMAATGEHVAAVALRDAGTSLLGEAPPIVVVDVRYQPGGHATLAALCRSRPRAAVIALFEGRTPLGDLYKTGVVSVTSAVPETVVACMQSLARQRRYMSNESAIAEGVRSSFARLRRIIADLRSGLLGTSVSSNLMAAVAESLDRGVLLVPHLERMVALGAFGNTLQGAPLARTTHGLIFDIGDSGVFKSCVSDSRARRLDYGEAKLPRAFRDAVDRPRTGEIAVLSVPGSERVIAVVYMDNGARERPIGDIEIFELAAFQLGLALENEFLRRAKPTSASADIFLDRALK